MKLIAIPYTQANDMQKKATESFARELKIKSSVEPAEVKRSNKKTFGQVAKTIIFSHKIRQRIRARSGDGDSDTPARRRPRRNSQEDDPESYVGHRPTTHQPITHRLPPTAHNPPPTHYQPTATPSITTHYQSTTTLTTVTTHGTTHATIGTSRAGARRRVAHLGEPTA